MRRARNVRRIGPRVYLLKPRIPKTVVIQTDAKGFTFIPIQQAIRKGVNISSLPSTSMTEDLEDTSFAIRGPEDVVRHGSTTSGHSVDKLTITKGGDPKYKIPKPRKSFRLNLAPKYSIKYLFNFLLLAYYHFLLINTFNK